MDKVKWGTFAYVSIPAADDAAFSWWHSADHIPEMLSLPGVHYAARYVATPELMAARPGYDPAFHPSQYFVSYYLGGESLAPARKQMEQTHNRLDGVGRIFPRQDIHSSGSFDLVGGQVSPRVPIRLEGLPYRPHKGVYITLLDLADARRHVAAGAYYDKVGFPEMLSIKGFAGVWRFISRAEPGWRGFPNPPERFLHVYFLDEDPAEAIEDLRQRRAAGAALGKASEVGAPTVVLAGGFRSITFDMLTEKRG